MGSDTGDKQMKPLDSYRLQNFRNIGFPTAALAVGLLVGQAPPATAQENDDDREEIVVTGTQIRGVEVIGSATQTIDSEIIEQSGKISLGDFMRELPINFAGGVGISDEVQSAQDAGPAGANLAGGQGINLRGLGALSTLVLINGRRAPASGQFGDFVDVSTIPLSAVERIEILQDGASAVYGSDAVGGVVNFILKDHIDGPLTNVQLGTTTDGGGEEILASQLFNLDWDDGNVLLGIEYYSRDRVAATDRAPYENGSDFSDRGGINWQRISAHYSPQANLFLGGQGGAVDSPVGASVPIGSNTNLTNADLIPSTDGNGAQLINVYDGLDVLPKSERISVWAALNHDFSDRVSAYGDARFSNRESSYNLGYGFLVENSLPTTSQFYIDDIDPALTNADGSIPFGLLVDDRLETRSAEVDSLGINTGLVVGFGDTWQLDTGISYARDEQRRLRRQLANVPLAGTMNFVTCALDSPNSSNPDCAALNLTPLNPWSTDPLSSAQLDELFGFEDLSFDSSVTELTAKIDGEVMDLGGGPLKLATGVEYREESIDGFLDWNTGSLEVRSGPYTKTERDAFAAFAEIAAPVHDTLNLSLAVRYEDFSGTGDYSSTDPKFGFNWRPTDSFKFRGSIGTAFHAPPMRYENDDPQPLPGGNAAFILPTFYRGPCDSDIVEFNGIIGTPGTPGEQCSFSLIINSGGAGPGVLEPEEAETWSLGFEYSDGDETGFFASVNYFNISIEDRIQRIQGGTFPGIVAELFATGTSPFISALNIGPAEAEAQAIIDSAKFLGTFGPPIANNAADIQMIVNATQINIASLDTAGFDFDLRYRWSAGGSEWSLFTFGTWLTEYDTEAAPGAGVVDQLGKYSSFGAPVQLRSIQGLSFANGDWDGQLLVKYTDSYECAVGSCLIPDTNGAPTPNTSPVGVDSWATVDLNIGWDLSGKLGSFGEGARLVLLVNNLFNEDPPFIDGGTSSVDNLPTAYDPNNATIINRVVSLRFTKRW